MKIFIIFFVVFISLMSCNIKKENINSNDGNYADGNGTIIYSKIDGNTQWIFRKHIQCINLPYWHDDFKELIIYNEPLIENAAIIATIKNGTLNITQTAEASVGNDFYSWIKISTNSNINGWIFCGKYNDKMKYTSVEQRIPYFNNNWEIMEYIDVGGKSWTIRKLKQSVCVWNKKNIHDNPGINNTNIITQIIPTEENDSEYKIRLNVTEVTEEMETIDGITDRWLKINYNNIDGWIFGGKITVERGGPTYFTPEDIIDWEISYLTDSN